jgi:hypothetical protein
MPKIFEYLGYVIYIYTNDHLPVHIHIMLGEKEVKCNIEYDNGEPNFTFKKVKGKKILSESEIKEISKFVEKYHFEIVEKWNDILVFHKPVKSKKITKKL